MSDKPFEVLEFILEEKCIRFEIEDEVAHKSDGFDGYLDDSGSTLAAIRVRMSYLRFSIYV